MKLTRVLILNIAALFLSYPTRAQTPPEAGTLQQTTEESVTDRQTLFETKKANSESEFILANLKKENRRKLDIAEAAEKKGTNNEVKAFAQALVRDHQKAEKLIQDFARKENLALDDISAASAAPEHASPPADSISETTSNFDRAFVAQVLKGNKESIQELSEGEQQLKNPEAKRIVHQILTDTRRHKLTAERLAKKLESPTTSKE